MVSAHSEIETSRQTHRTLTPQTVVSDPSAEVASETRGGGDRWARPVQLHSPSLPALPRRAQLSMLRAKAARGGHAPGRLGWRRRPSGSQPHAPRVASAFRQPSTRPPVHHLPSSNAKSRLDRSPARTRGRGAEQQARGRARQGRGPAVGLGPCRLRTRPSGARRRTERRRGPSNLRSGTRGAVAGPKI